MHAADWAALSAEITRALEQQIRNEKREEKLRTEREGKRRQA
jgi:predicted secreted protein